MPTLFIPYRNSLFFWTSRRIILYGAIILLCACHAHGKKYENKQYRVVFSQLPLKLAITPIYHDDTDVRVTLDTVFQKMYFDTGLVEPISPGDLREKIQVDTGLSSLLALIIDYEYSKEQRKSTPSLSQILDSAQIAYFTQALDSADLLLVPMKFGVGSIFGTRTGGKLSLRLFDLHSKELIYEIDQDLNVDLTGKVGRDYLLLGLVAFTRDPYHKFLLDQIEKQVPKK